MNYDLISKSLPLLYVEKIAIILQKPIEIKVGIFKIPFTISLAQKKLDFALKLFVYMPGAGTKLFLLNKK